MSRESDRSPRRRSLLEWVCRLLFRVYPKSYRNRHSEIMIQDMLEEFEETLQHARRGELREVLGVLFGEVVIHLIFGGLRERGTVLVRGVGVLFTRRGLLWISGVAAIIAGVNLMAHGVVSWLSMTLFFEYPGFAMRLPLSQPLQNPFLIDSLTVVAIAGLCLVAGPKGTAAKGGMIMAGVWAALTLFLTIYDVTAKPVYYSGADFGGSGPQRVDQFAVTVLQLESWSIALAITLLAGAALASRNLRHEWCILLVGISFIQSPLLPKLVFLFFQRSMEYSMHLQGPLELMLTLQTMREGLFHAMDILPGISWTLLGCLILINLRRLRPDREVKTGTVQRSRSG